jgi:hypothetical protein
MSLDFFVRITPFWMLAQAMAMACGGVRSIAKGLQFAGRGVCMNF